MKKWGRVRIENELNLLGLSTRNIACGLKEIETDDYEKALRQLLEKKGSQISEPDDFKKRDKLAKYAIGRGYEPDLVWKMVKEILP